MFVCSEKLSSNHQTIPLSNREREKLFEDFGHGRCKPKVFVFMLTKRNVSTFKFIHV